MTLTRYRLLLALRQSSRPLCLTELVALLEMPTGTVSMQLTRCYRSGYVSRKEHVYWLTKKGMSRVEWMMQNMYFDIQVLNVPGTGMGGM